MQDKTIADEIFAECLREFRKEAGKTQEQLALDAGLERTYISMLELCQRRPTLKTLIQLARGLGIPLSKLIENFENEYEKAAGIKIHLVHTN